MDSKDFLPEEKISKIRKMFGSQVLVEQPDGENYVLNCNDLSKTNVSMYYSNWENLFGLPDGKIIACFELQNFVVEKNYIRYQETRIDDRINCNRNEAVLLTSKIFACLAKNGKAIHCYLVNNLRKPFCSIETQIACSSLTALGQNHLVVGGEKGEIIVFTRTGEMTFEKTDVIKMKGEICFVKSLGKDRNILIVVEGYDPEQVGSTMQISSWCLDEETGRLVKKVARSYDISGCIDFAELEEREQFILVTRSTHDGKTIGISLWDKRLQAVAFDCKEKIWDVVGLTEGRAIILTSESKLKLLQFNQIEFLQDLKKQVEDSTPFHKDLGDFSKLIAEYAFDSPGEQIDVMSETVKRARFKKIN